MKKQAEEKERVRLEKERLVFVYLMKRKSAHNITAKK
jgi:hypothetical protein